MSHRINTALLCTVAACGWLKTAGVAADSGSFQMTRWTTQQGLPQNTVRCLWQTRDGYLWAGTRDGLARFNGIRFTVFNHSNTPEMLSDDCVRLAEDNQGGLWVGTEDGLLLWKNFHFVSFRPGEKGLCDGRIRSLSAGHDGGMWIGTENGLDYWKDGAFTHFTTRDGLYANNVRAVFEDSQRRVWASSDMMAELGGLQRMEAGSRTFVGFPTNWTSTARMAHYLIEDRSGEVWWGDNDGLHRFGVEGVKTFGRKQGLSGEVTKWLDQGPSGDILVVTGERGPALGRRGLHRFNGEVASRIELDAYGLDDDVLCALEDLEGNLWVGTRHEGLIQLQPRRIQSFTVREGLSNGNVLSVCEGVGGAIFAGTSRGLNVIENHSAKSIEHNRGRPVRCVYPTSAHDLWIGGPLGDLSQLFDNMTRSGSLTSSANLGQSGINALFEDGLGVLWVGHSQGVIQFTLAGVPRPALHNFPKSDVRAILQGHTGDLWFGTFGNGVIRRHNGEYSSLTTRDGLSHNRAWALHEDSDGVLWIGTESGLNRYKNGVFRALSVRDGLYDDRIHCILEDRLGFFWISCQRGIYKVSLRQLNEVSDGKTKSVHCVAYGEADGLPSSETSGGSQPAAWKARDGRLWFATGRGVAAIDPTTIGQNTVAPPVVIEQVIGNEQIVYGNGMKSGGTSPEPKAAALVTFAPGRARVMEIHYTANSFCAPEKVRFEYRLAGHDAGWRRDDANRRVAFYTDLPPGKYRFEVRAFNNHGVPSRESASLSFILEPHFYRTWPFYLFCGVSVAGAGALIQAWRLGIQRRISGLERVAALERERSRIASDLHDELGSGLAQVVLLSGVENGQAPALLGRSREIAREMMQKLDGIVWSLNPARAEAGSVVDYLAGIAEQFVGATTMQLRLDLPQQQSARALDASQRHHLLLALKEMLRNAAVHSHGRTITLRVVFSGEMMEVAVRDDGDGFDPARRPSHRHGLSNLERRAAGLGGTFELRTATGHGTEVMISFPLGPIRPNVA